MAFSAFLHPSHWRWTVRWCSGDNSRHGSSATLFVHPAAQFPETHFVMQPANVGFSGAAAMYRAWDCPLHEELLDWAETSVQVAFPCQLATDADPEASCPLFPTCGWNLNVVGYMVALLETGRTYVSTPSCSRVQCWFATGPLDSVQFQRVTPMRQAAGWSIETSCRVLMFLEVYGKMHRAPLGMRWSGLLAAVRHGWCHVLLPLYRFATCHLVDA